MNRALGSVILTASGAGFPLTQLAIARLGRGGAVLAEAVAAGLLARDAALVASGALARLERGPAALLLAETAVAAAAVAAGAAALTAEGLAAARSPGWRVGRAELARRAAVGALFGIHTWRFRVYLSPGSGRRALAPDTAS